MMGILVDRWKEVVIGVCMVACYAYISYLKHEVLTLEEDKKEIEMKYEILVSEMFKKKQEYEANLATYTQEVQKLDAQKKDVLTKIKGFTRRANESECESADRMLDEFRY